MVIFSHSLTGNKRHFNLSSRPFVTLLFWLLPPRNMIPLLSDTLCSEIRPCNVAAMRIYFMYHSLWRGILVVHLAKAISMFPWQPGFESSMRLLSRHPFISNISCLSFSLWTVNCQRQNIATLSNFETGHILLWQYLWHASVLRGKIPGLIILSCWHLGRALLLGHAQVN